MGGCRHQVNGQRESHSVKEWKDAKQIEMKLLEVLMWISYVIVDANYYFTPASKINNCSARNIALLYNYAKYQNKIVSSQQSYNVETQPLTISPA